MAVKKKDLNHFAVIIAAILGVALWVLASSSFKHITDKCTLAILRDGLTIINVLGAVMVAASVCYAACNWWGGDCYANADNAGENTEVYLTIVFGISIIMLVLSIVMYSEYLKHKDECGDSSSLRYNLIFIIVLAAILAAITSVGLYYVIGVVPGHYKKTGAQKKKSKSSSGRGWRGMSIDTSTD
jgi:hypothetical protein